MTVSGRATCTSDGQVKAGELRSGAIAFTAGAASDWLWEAVRNRDSHQLLT